ncbi:MAG: M56 family metallopeptidase, partial [Planctomycetes bacterium]|nr:M56 family metallopeptidase [Planctomycetota bacterium]
MNTEPANTGREHFPISYAGSTDIRDGSNYERSRALKPAAWNPGPGTAIVDQGADPQLGANRSASSKKSFAETLGWRQFAAKLANVRDAVLALPSIPSRIWLGGFIVLVIGCALRVWLFNRRVRSAFAAPQSVVDLVREAAGSIGLRRLPGVFFVHERIPPMVWGARRPRLFLPVTLWAQLDPVGRRAVVCHELAHLRRRDHWLCWADTLIGAIYWWHPVVWWVRHRLHDEAENCCDAWVTHLMPHDRRAYAEALLQAKQYVSTDNVRVPTVGIGVTKGRARRFARRITMVMTKRVAPRLSVWGLALAFLMGGAGWLTSPAWACPPKAKTSKLTVTAPNCDEKGAGNVVVVGIGSDKSAACCAKAKCESCKTCKLCKLCKSGTKCAKCESATAPYVALGRVPMIRTVAPSAYTLLGVSA